MIKLIIGILLVIGYTTLMNYLDGSKYLLFNNIRKARDTIKAVKNKPPEEPKEEESFRLDTYA